MPFEWYDTNLEKSIRLSKRNYALDERIKFGLPITTDEYQNELESVESKQLKFEKKYGIKLK